MLLGRGTGALAVGGRRGGRGSSPDDLGDIQYKVALRKKKKDQTLVLSDVVEKKVRRERSHSHGNNLSRDWEGNWSDTFFN